MKRLAFGVTWRALYILATLIAVGVIPIATNGVRAGDSTIGPLTLTTTMSTPLTDGQTVQLHVHGTGISLYSLTTHICIPGRVNGDYAFSFVGPFCSNQPVGSGQVEAQAVVPGSDTADLAVKVGSGSANWISERGYHYQVTCDPTAPCEMVVKIEVTNGTVYARVPLCYANCPADAPVTFVGPPAITGGATAVTPVVGRSSGSGPPSGTVSAAGGATAPAPPAAAHTSPAAPTQSRSSRPAASPQITNNAKTIADTSGGLARNVRVLLAGLVGALGGMRIIAVLSRSRRKTPQLEAL